jgi:hypothetical protein
LELATYPAVHGRRHDSQGENAARNEDTQYRSESCVVLGRLVGVEQERSDDVSNSTTGIHSDIASAFFRMP